MAASPSSDRNEVEKKLEAQLAELRSELAQITKSISKQGGHILDDIQDNASQAYDSVRKHGRQAVQEVSHQAQIVKQTARENPVATVAIIAGVSLLLALLARR